MSGEEEKIGDEEFKKVIKQLKGYLTFLEMYYRNPEEWYEFRKDVFRTEGEGWVVDTCKPPDTNLWETGISRDGEKTWSIVEQYKNRDEAKKGHEKWVKLMRENPNRELPNIDIYENVEGL